MKEWFSLSEIAGSPNMPSGVSGVRRKAERECWQLRDRQAVGGGKEYHWASFSEETKTFLTDKFGDLSTNVDSVAGVVIDEDTNHIPDAGKIELIEEMADLVVADNKNADDKAFEMPIESDKSTAVTLARVEIVRMAQKYLMDRKAISPKVKKVAVFEEFAEKVESGAIQIPDFVRIGLATAQGKLKLSRASLTNWEGKSLKDLHPNHKGKEGFFAQRPDYEMVAEAFVRNYPDNAARMLHHAFESGLIREDFGLEDAPSYSQIYVWLKNRKAKNKQLERAFRTGDKSIMLPAFGSLSRGLKPNDKWEIDSTKPDAICFEKRQENIIWLHSTTQEKAVRCALVACVDVATRRLKIKLYPTDNSEAICLLLNECIADWGLPKLLKTDNGKNYISEHVSQYLFALNIEQKTCIVKHPWEKGHIERLMRSLQHSAPWKKLPWATGHSVAAQQARRKINEGEAFLPRTMEWFQGWIDDWVADYHTRQHGEMGISPFEKLATFTADGFVAVKPKDLEATLTFAMMREKTVTVGKKGISYRGRFYVAPELIEHFGEKLAIRFDPNNVNQILVYSSTDINTAELICAAQWSESLTDEQLARIATAKPAVNHAFAENEKKIKRTQKRIKQTFEKNPEKLLPERGGIAALAAFQEMEVNSSNLVKAIEAAAAKPVVNTDAPEMQAKRQEWLDMQAKKDAEKPVVEEVRNGRDWLRIWQMSDRPIAETEWLLQTIDLGGYGGFVAMVVNLPLEQMREMLNQELRDRVA